MFLDLQVRVEARQRPGLPLKSGPGSIYWSYPARPGVGGRAVQYLHNHCLPSHWSMSIYLSSPTTSHLSQNPVDP